MESSVWKDRSMRTPKMRITLGDGSRWTLSAINRMGTWRLTQGLREVGVGSFPTLCEWLESYRRRLA